MIACPGGDFCALANARSIPIAAAITERFDDLDELYDIGDIDLHISGCINSCGHHHSGHIGILGVDKDGSEWYQVTVGGSDGSTLSGARRAGQGDRPVLRRRRGARRHRGGDRHLPRASASAASVHRHRRRLGTAPFRAAADAVRRATGRRRRLKDTTMRFIDTRQDRWHRVEGEDGPLPAPRPAGRPPADAGAMARGARAPGRAAWPPACCCPTRWTWTRWPTTCAARRAPVAGGAAVPQVDRRPRLQPGACCCARACASTARCAPSATCWSTCCRCCSAPASTPCSCAPTRSSRRRQRALGFFAGHYQGDVQQPRPGFAATWRRAAAQATAPSCAGRHLTGAIALYARASARLRRARGACGRGAAVGRRRPCRRASCRPPAWAPRTWCSPT